MRVAVSNAVISLAVLAGHVAVISSVAFLASQSDKAAIPDDSGVLVATILPHRRPPPQFVPLPAVSIAGMAVDVASVHFDYGDSDWDVVAGVTGSASAPQLASGQTCDPILYARRAGLTDGHAATTLLNFEVRADGSVGQVSISVSSGSTSVDDEAINCALSLKWVPGSIRRHAKTMRISFPLTLSVPGY